MKKIGTVSWFSTLLSIYSGLDVHEMDTITTIICFAVVMNSFKAIGFENRETQIPRMCD